MLYVYICAHKDIKITVMEKLKTDAKALSDYLSTLTRNEKRVALDKLEAGCLVPRYTIYNWLRGFARIPKLHKIKIEEIIGQKIFDEFL